MFRKLFSRKPASVPALCLEAEQEFGERYEANMLMQHDNLCLGLMCRLELMNEKRFHGKVLFPHFSIPTPATMCASDFNGEFYPIFLKELVGGTFYVDSAEELAQHREKNDFEYSVIQEYIKPSTQVASHIRIVVAPFFMDVDEDSILGAAVLYNTEKDEHRSNHRHGGKGIALTGKGALEDISDFEMQILGDLRINPHKREIPAEILQYVYELRDSDGKRLYDYLGWAGSEVGIDTVFGRPFSYDHPEHGEGTPKWYFLEVQPLPSTSLLEEIGAWLPEK